MRVAYVSTDPGVPVFGRKGSSVHVQALLRVLVRAGVTVHLVTVRPGDDVPADLLAGPGRVVVHPVPVVPTRTTAEREIALRAADALVGPVLDALAADGRLDLVYERYSLWGTAATAWARRSGTPSVLEVNAPLPAEQARHRELVDAESAERCARAAIGAAGTVVAVSGPVARWAAERATDPARVHVLPNGVDTARVTPAHRPDGRFTVAFVGTLKPWHGLDVLLDAFALVLPRVPRARLLVVGDGPQAAAVDDRVRGLGLGDVVERTGAVAPSDVPALLHRADVGVAPYPALDDFYFSPLKAYEYLAAGLPVVASAIGELPAALTGADGAPLGLLVPPGDAAALADALVALAADPARRATLGTRAREAAVARHDWTVVVGRALDLAGVALPVGEVSRG
ncbi:glycosyltransferase family 4 protein [Cellulosimicrobium sp. NPDC057127]|uniref:glycosyltransferase family 4 protein n=1 Tax=Cellulosimicrobium sp. NPDC057127 TaxID=3346026 RepID=UPI0036300695